MKKYLKKLLLYKNPCPLCKNIINYFLVKAYIRKEEGYYKTGITYGILYSCNCGKYAGALSYIPSNRELVKLFLFGKRIKDNNWKN